jgi:hypothetical protein
VVEVVEGRGDLTRGGGYREGRLVRCDSLFGGCPSAKGELSEHEPLLLRADKHTRLFETSRRRDQPSCKVSVGRAGGGETYPTDPHVGDRLLSGKGVTVDEPSGDKAALSNIGSISTRESDR